MQVPQGLHSNGEGMLQKRIPTIIGLLLLIAGTVAGLLAVQTVQRVTGEAASGTVPDDIRVSNISDQGFTVSWITEKDTTGFISYGTTQRLGQTVFDDRSSGNAQFISSTHFISLKNLKPDTPYYFKIGSGRTLFDNQGEPYKQTTTPIAATTPPIAEPVYGTVKTDARSPVANALVYLSVKGSVLSTLTKVDGNWLIPISNLRTADGKTYTQLPDTGATLDLFVQAGSAGTATATVDVSNTKPVPDIMLGKERQAFGSKQKVPEISLDSPLTSTPAATAQPAPAVSTPAASETRKTASPSATITIELVNNQQLATTQPTFRGTGTAGTKITLRVESVPQTATVTVASDGTWQWKPPQPLDSGSHTLTVTPQGGAPIVRSFQIAAPVAPPAVSTPAATTPPPSLPNAGEPWTTFLLIITGSILIASGGVGLVCGRRGFLRW